MKRLKLMAVSGVFLFCIGALSVQAQSDRVDYCAKEQARESAKSSLSPYRYSGYKSKTVTVRNYNQISETYIEMLYDVPYKLVFNLSGLPEAQQVEIVIYDKPYPKKNREILWRSTRTGNEIVFETTELQDYFGDLYIEYVLPAYEEPIAKGMIIKGCIVLTVGYNNLVIAQEPARN